MQIIADVLGIHPVEVYASPPSTPSCTPEPAGPLRLPALPHLSCDSPARKRSPRQLADDLGIDFGETTADGAFSLEWANCMGMCDQGPAMLVNDEVYTQLTPDKVHDDRQDCRACADGTPAVAKEGVSMSIDDDRDAGQRAHLRHHPGRRRPQGGARHVARRHHRHGPRLQAQGPRRRRLPHRHQVELRRRREGATRSTSSATPTRASRAPSRTGSSSASTPTWSSRA